MFRKLSLDATIAVLLAPALLGQSVDEIIAKHTQARGGMDGIKSIQTVRSTGTIVTGPGYEAAGFLIEKRPGMARLEFTFQDMTSVVAYDGEHAWLSSPPIGTRSADDMNHVEEHIDGPLVDYRSKGTQVQLLGKENLEGKDSYKLRATPKNGDVIIVYLDAGSFLEIKEELKRNVRGNVLEEEMVMGDYKEVNGVMFPFAIEYVSRVASRSRRSRSQTSNSTRLWMM